MAKMTTKPRPGDEVRHEHINRATYGVQVCTRMANDLVIEDDPNTWVIGGLLAAAEELAWHIDAMEEDRLKALKAGCDDYATKPVDFPELLKKIGALSHS